VKARGREARPVGVKPGFQRCVKTHDTLVVNLLAAESTSAAGRAIPSALKRS